VVAGSSAGGFGALLNYDAFRRTWPASRGYLVDDSGPPFEAGAIPQAELDAWFASWGLGEVLDPLCGAACRTGLSAGLAAVESLYPGDRLALLSSLQDQVISGYFLMNGAQFQQDLLQLAADVIDPSSNARGFFVSGNTHTMLITPAAFTQGVPLLVWLGQQLSDDPAWVSRRP
jgi:hypothetical protein